MNPATGLPPREGKGRRPQKQKTKSKPKPKPSIWRQILKAVIIVIILAILAVGAYAVYIVMETDKAITEISTVDEDKPVPPEQSAKVKPLSLLLLGVDTRSETGSLNTDVFMVATLNPETKSATVVSVPRDTLVDLDGYKNAKINSFYAGFKSQERRHKVSNANDEMKTMMSKFFDIPIDYIAVINFKGFVDVVDALGGVEVNVDMDMRYKDSADGTNINLKKGFQKLNGEKALDFVRYRKSNTKKPTKASSDFDRNRRQSEVLHEMVRKLQTFDGLTKIPEIIQSVGKNLKMDVEKDQIKDLISTYFTINKDNIKFIPVDGKWKSPYVRLDKASLDAAKQALKDQLALK